MLKLYTFFQSGSAYRARIALSLKGLDYEPIFVVGGRGSQDLRQPEYLALNPSAVLPTLIDGDVAITQSVAILEYLEERFPEPALLPEDPIGRARVRALSQVIISDTHPLTTARVIDYLDGTLKLQNDALANWTRYWNERGFGSVEKMLAGSDASGGYSHGTQPTMADIALVSQAFVAKKFGADLSIFPNVNRVYNLCMEQSAFRDTAPATQPDATSD